MNWFIKIKKIKNGYICEYNDTNAEDKDIINIKVFEEKEDCIGGGAPVA